MGFREFCRRWNFRWKMLTWSDIFKVSVDETITMTRYSVVPSLFCMGLEVLGQDNFLFLLILSIVAAYFAHKKQMLFSTLSGFLSPLELVRYMTFFLIILKCTYLIPYMRYPKKFQDVDEIPYRFIGCYAKVVINVVVFRVYLISSGAITKSVNKYQKNSSIKTNPPPSSPKQVPMQPAGDGKVSAE